MTTPSLPHFISIGAARSGSTWLHQTLINHPDIYIPPAKDTQYFLEPRSYSLKWYLNFFRNAQPHQICGEICHRYLTNPHAARDIAKTLPQVKILVCLRNPVERTISAYKYGAEMGLHNKTFAQFSRDPQALVPSHYTDHLKPYFAHFPREQIHISFYDDLRDNPSLFLASIFQFLGVSPYIGYDHFHRIWASRPARFPALTAFAYTVAQWLRSLGMYSLVGHLKRSQWLNSLLFRDERISNDDIDTASLEFLSNYFSSTVKSLEDLIGTSVPQSWHRSPTLCDSSSSPRVPPSLALHNIQLS